MDDLISRDDAIRELSGACSTWEDDAKVQEIVMAIPSAEQVAGKLNNPCDSLLKADSDECKEQKSKLDLISRADAIEAVASADETNGTVKVFSGLEVIDILKALPSAEIPTTGEKHQLSAETPTNAPTDLISRADAMGEVQDHFNADGFKGYDDGQKMMDRINALPSAEAVQGYTEWLEKIIVMLEPEYLCEDTTDKEWCEENCHYSSIQAECLRHLYEVSKGGGSE